MTMSLNDLAYAITYLAIIAFLAGSVTTLTRWIFRQKGPKGTYLGFKKFQTYPGLTSRLRALKNIISRALLMSSAKNDKFVRFTSLIFHWSLWIIIIAHSDLFLMPFFRAHGIPEYVIETIGAYLGTSLAFVMVATGIILLTRRITNPYLKRISNVSDYFSILLVVLVGISGIAMRFYLPADYAYTQVAPFIASILRLAPYGFPTSFLFVFHFFLVLSLLVYFPYSKLFHPFAFLTNPSMYSLSEKGDVQ